MSTTSFARNAYAISTKSTATPRAIEYQLLTRINGALIAAETNKISDHPGFVRALSRNLEFWTVLATDAAHPENKLSAPLRAQLFYLFEFTRMLTRKILNGDASAKANPLIEINKNVLVGLRGIESAANTP